MRSDVLTIAATGGGTASSITFGTGAAEVDTLTELNAALAANNLQASVDDATGKITITTTNDAASSTVGALGGTAIGAGKAFLPASTTVVAKVADAASQATRANLVSQYNNIITQITTTAQDSSFNGINLLNGDDLKLTFNETGKSTLNIKGVTFNAAGLGLASLTSAPTSWTAFGQRGHRRARHRVELAALAGVRLGFEPVDRADPPGLLQEPDQRAADRSSNLTLADTNEEAANSQALSTRQSIAVSALALANQSQQSVLQLLR